MRIFWKIKIKAHLPIQFLERKKQTYGKQDIWYGAKALPNTVYKLSGTITSR